MDNHNRSKKHAENISRLVLELADDAEDPHDDDGDDRENDDDDKLNAADADSVELTDDLPEMSQTR